MLIFQEPRPEIAIRRLDDLHALSQIHSELRGDRWIESKFAALREELDPTLSPGGKPSVDFFMYIPACSATGWKVQELAGIHSNGSRLAGPILLTCNCLPT